MNRYELEPKLYKHGSYNGLAYVEIKENGDKHLISYVTHVATVTADGKAEIIESGSTGTVRHIKDFLYQHGFDSDKPFKDLRKMYMKVLD